MNQGSGLSLSRRRFLNAFVASASAWRCDPDLPRPVMRPGPAPFDGCAAARNLSVLTWNVFMMPEWIHESPLNQPRARAIAETILEQDFDIICLQKVFDASARAILENALGERYPHRYGPANRGCLRLNSGVLVLSRNALFDYQEMIFDRCSSWECFALKGAMLLSGTCATTPFRLIATHLQGEEGSAFTAKNQAVRDAQMAQIRDRFMAPHLEPNVPFIVCGDFGTPRFADACGDETASYHNMLSTLGVENGLPCRITLDETDNELARSDTRRKNELDYVLVRKNGCELDVERTRHVFKRSGWDAEQQRTDLSYRYAVGAKVTFGPV